MKAALEEMEGDGDGISLVEALCEGPSLQCYVECGLYFVGVGKHR